MAKPHATRPPPASREDWRALRRVLPLLWPAGRPDLKRRVVAAVGLVVAAKTTTVLMPFALKGLVDAMSAAPGAEAVGVALGLVAAWALARFGTSLFDNLRNLLFERVAQAAWLELATRTFAHLHELSLGFHLDRRTGELARTLERGTKAIDSVLYLTLFNLMPVALELLAVLGIFAARLGGGLALGTLAGIVAYAVFTWRVTRWRTRLRVRANELDGKAAARAVDSLLNYEAVKQFGAEAREVADFARLSRAHAEAALKVETSLALLNLGQAAIMAAILGGAMAWAVVGWAEGRLSPGDVVLVHALLLQLFRPLEALGWVYRDVRQGLVDMAQLWHLLDTPVEVRDPPGAPALVVRRGEIVFDRVRFAYRPGVPVLRDVSFRVPPGGRVAIVGRSGSGKSTIVRLLFRLHDVDAGAIRIDGQDIRAVRQQSLRRAIGIVPQEPALFHDTLGANIGFGRADAAPEEVRRAAEAAQLGALIARLPAGLDTPVGERGFRLSGGERQRVAIARVLLKDPPILVLDEATSALDSRTEAEIRAALDALARGRTTIVIAHRLSTVADAERILVLEDGRIVAAGTHSRLLAEGGLYRELWERQQGEAASFSALAGPFVRPPA
ncbi:MAG: ABC transporter ATP-binding protein/permease [Sphingomonadaceae bacterium]|uniref:ABCB family ABC transporter ATP-binding protein/permease n=1 Tax=Thermaurantiacus sp. TaxID=2820283 RepID=UPI00298EDA27|nr:ABC transporter ATP-binding protein/permease [Thermaurantiacus sp.]MCS6987070.1 ABC transporter ATP-binding protein/permease [Sphingomonadaceae bacterium]MDW8415592.1 ABC transporter ATP-binding protein/permease [Thermaurantiacus sp.]